MILFVWRAVQDCKYNFTVFYICCSFYWNQWVALYCMGLNLASLLEDGIKR